MFVTDNQIGPLNE